MQVGKKTRYDGFFESIFLKFESLITDLKKFKNNSRFKQAWKMIKKNAN